MRGTLYEVFVNRCSSRVIPACAGNAPSASSSGGQSAGHPRVCGERDTSISNRLRYRGSSPRVRGTLDVPEVLSPVSRVIPACAGNARLPVDRRCPSAGHPRVCGERPGACHPGTCAPGSSPRVRGTLGSMSARRLRRRVIPACAGNALATAASVWSRSGHPRVCGERKLPVRVRPIGIGSSPRVRGTHTARRRLISTVRVIPACAGNAVLYNLAVRISAGHPRVCGEHRGISFSS